MNEKDQKDQPKFSIGHIDGGIVNVGGQMSIDQAQIDVGRSSKDEKTSPSPRPAEEAARLGQLRRKITTYLSLTDVRTLCFDLGFDYDQLAGDGPGDRVLELLNTCYRHNKIDALQKICRELNPAVDWSEGETE